MADDFDTQSLSFTPERMRELGYRVVDMIVDHHHNLPEKRVATHADRDQLLARLHAPPPSLPSDPGEVISQVQRDLLACMTYSNHPRFFAYIPGPANFIGVLGDALASGFNVINALWMEASAPAQIELTAIDWLRQWCGLPTEAGGLFVSGGSVANLTGLAVARQIKLANDVKNARIYCSEQTHGSVEKSLKLLGFQRDQLVKLPVDTHFRLDLERLDGRVGQDRSAGCRPFCVIANAGTTNTGAVDPLYRLSEYCQQHDMWLHVDGAYGVPAILTANGKKLLAGLDLADSIAVDPHKWLFQPFEIGCALVRDANWLPQTFGQRHEYMQDASVDLARQEVNFCDYGIQLTRGFRALKFWMTIKTFGTDAIRDAIERGTELAEFAQALLQDHGGFEITSPAQLGIVSFRFAATAGPDEDYDRINLAIVEALFNDGFSMISSTQLAGKTCLRLCTINPRTTRYDIETTIEKIARCGHVLM